MSATGKYIQFAALLAVLFLGAAPAATLFFRAAPAAAQSPSPSEAGQTSAPSPHLDDLWELLLDQPPTSPPDQEEAPAAGPLESAAPQETAAPSEAAAETQPAGDQPIPLHRRAEDEKFTPKAAMEEGAEANSDSLGWLEDFDWQADPEAEGGPPVAQPAAGQPTASQPESGPAETHQAETNEAETSAGLFAPSSFEELLAREEGREFLHEGRTYLWRDGVPFEKSDDGALLAVEPPDHLYEVGADGRKWLSREADGTVYINVAPKIWATINFAHDSDVIEEDSKPVLDVFGASLATPALGRHRLIIAGHTNNLGRPEYNLKLSRRRAQSVAHYLVEKHRLDPGRLILHGYGDERPLADNETEEGLTLNRRVEFILLGPPTAAD